MKVLTLNNTICDCGN